MSDSHFMPSQRTRREVILFALEDRFSLARIPSLLYHAGCRVVVLGDPNTPVCSSRFVEKVIPCPIDPPSAAKALAQLIWQYGNSLPWVVFGDELALQAGILCREQKWLSKIFPVDPFKCADMIFRKAAFMEAAALGGIPIPPMRICTTVADAKKAAEDLNFPLFFKRDVDCAGAGVSLVSTKSGVVPTFQKLSDTGPVVIQEMIDGAVGKTNMLYSHGRLMCHTSAYATRTWPGKFGPSCIRKYFCDPQLERIAVDLGKLTGFHGLCGFDWVQDRRTGQFIVIEFNGRTIATYHLGKHVHVNYEAAIGDFLDGNATIREPWLHPGEAPIVHMFPQDVRRCITEYDLLGMAKWLIGSITTDMPWSDANLILFFYTDFIRLGYKRLRRFLRRRMKRVAVVSSAPAPEQPAAHVMA
jgi:predicted ATP-grasp superfamily ATP-dependent carboligase